jgi:nitric oxide reductase subunit C
MRWRRRVIVMLSVALATSSLAGADRNALVAPPTLAAAGNAAEGGRLFARLPCASCHDLTKPWPGGVICPNLGNIATEAARIVQSREYRGKARDAAGYIRESILDPNAYIVPGPNYRTPDGQSVMPKDFGQTLSASEVDDLVAFLLTRR